MKTQIKQKQKQKQEEKEKQIMPQNINTYLGQKGYTILKSDLPIEKQIWIKEQLMVKPYVPGSPVQLEKVFPVYRESDKKLYLPRYYGEELFGPAKEVKIPEGNNIDLQFNGTLRDYQEPVINKFLNHLNSSNSIGGLLELYCAWGKTSASLYICCQVKKKTLVIVHKEFLMNQWIERIKQFIPNARIGKIQGQTIDIEDKDIVLCMLQSLVLKDYPSSMFDSFGFTIIDEVHHISSETFSNALFKVVTKYMLGLSATMNRKDGTTNVFKMFLGNVIHKAERKNEIDVEIRAVTYKTNDEEFNETILDYKGQAQISSMISKLCTYNRRTEFIIKLLTDFISDEDVNEHDYKKNKELMDKNKPQCEMCNSNNNYLLKNTCCNCVKYCLLCLDKIKPIIKVTVTKTGQERKVTERPKCPHCKKVLKYEQYYIENPHVKPLEKCQTIVLSHNLNILEYIYNKFVCKNLASVGYYVGGMSEQELKISETKQVVLATYSMASEGLDIPTMNAEFLITPKTDVVQTVGRVLRAKHKYCDPIIYDIVDSHDTFQKQWLKRKKFYKTQNYKIIKTDSYNYNINVDNWKVDYDPNANGNKMKSACSSEAKLNSFVIKKCNGSRNLTEKSITSDSDEECKSEEENEDEDENSKVGIGKCLLKFKK